MNEKDMLNLAAGQIILKAEIAALLGLVQALAEKSGTPQIDGRPLLDYYVQERLQQLRSEAESVVSRSPELAKLLTVAANQRL